MIISKDLLILGDEYLSMNAKSSCRRPQINRNMSRNLSKSTADRLLQEEHLAHHRCQDRPVEVSFKNISVSVATKPSKPNVAAQQCVQSKRILDDVCGYARPGQILGIMGPSGSGKTTLLGALSGRVKPDRGCISLNGESLNKQLRRKICYVLQQDIFFPDLTLRQTLVYTAMLRLPDALPHEEKLRHVDHIIDVLDLRHCQDTIIGDILKRGLSGGEKKRASIACELLINPTVLLVDEPTSGLDSSTAHNLIQTLKEYAVKERKTLIATVHQPSSQIFYMFDKLLLLSGGKVAYFGDVSDVVPFFCKIGFEIAPHYNPADFVMEKVKQGAAIRDNIIAAAKQLVTTPSNSCGEDVHLPHLADHQLSPSSYSCDANCKRQVASPGSESHQSALWDSGDGDGDVKSLELRVVIEPCSKNSLQTTVYNKIVNDDDSGRSSWSDTDRSSTSTFSSDASHEDMCLESRSKAHKTPKWPTSFWTQLRVLTARNFYEARGRMLSKLNWVQTVGLGVVCGLIWLQVERREETLSDIRGWMFFSTTYWMLFALFGALISFPPEREVINKERASGAYRLSSYYVAKMIGELPLTLTLPTVFYVISYPMLGCHDLSTFLSLWAFLILSTVGAQSVGLFIGAACNDLEVSVTISALYSLSTMLFGGFYAATLPAWLAWLRYASMVYYAFQSMQMIEFGHGQPVTCAASNSRFAVCHSLLDSAAQLNSSTSPLSSPPLPSIPHQELMRSFDVMNDGADPLPISINTLILMLYLVTFRLLGYLVLRYFRKPK